MGNARRKKKRLGLLQATQPYCVYCGGSELGDTIDHMPPITVFEVRRRPKGLEFLACSLCNDGGRSAEQVVGWLSRVYPDPESELSRAEVRKIFKAISNNHPNLLKEMIPSFEQERRVRLHAGHIPEVGGALNVGGPLLNAAVHTFGAKVGFAIHFHHTGRIVPLSGAVAVRWYSNYDAVTGAIPRTLFELLGPPQTLRQGGFDVANQFNIASGISADGTLSAHFATFRRSFAVTAFVTEDSARLAELPHEQIFRPGWLKAGK